MKIVCFGDSITRGQVSFDWVAALAREWKEHTFINLGVNGNLAYHLLRRIEQVKRHRPDLVIVLVGTNDVYALTTPALTRRYVKSGKLPQTPSGDWYEENMRAILSELQQIPTRIALISLPPLGEDLEHEVNQKIRQYNQTLLRLKEEYACEWIDLYGAMQTYLRDYPPSKIVPVSVNLWWVVRAVLMRKLLFFSWNRISGGLGLRLTTDTIHLNETGGGLLLKELRLYFDQLQNHKNRVKKVVKTEEEWRRQLNDLEYRVLRQAGTERPFTGAYYEHTEKGVYSCAACGHDLFRSEHKYHSGCGWPSFWGELAEADLRRRPDYTHNMVRTELLCPACDSHLGHLFDDGPERWGGLRYCINSVCLHFKPDPDADPNRK